MVPSSAMGALKFAGVVLAVIAVAKIIKPSLPVGIQVYLP